MASRLVEALVDAGAPPGVIQFLPGDGEVVGARLVEHPDVAVIAFTGSKAVGLAINRQAAEHRPGQRHVKRVIAEMGGKNALIIDADADPDQAVPGAVVSAFGYAGQKCSAAGRLIVVGDVYDQVVERLVAATHELVVGPARRPGTQVGPVIDEDAHKRILRMLEDVPAAGPGARPARRRAAGRVLRAAHGRRRRRPRRAARPGRGLRPGAHRAAGGGHGRGHRAWPTGRTTR